MLNVHSQMRSVVIAVALILPLAGCGGSISGQPSEKEEAKDAVVKTIEADIKGDTGTLKTLVAPAQRENVGGNPPALQMALKPYTSVSADTAMLKEDHGQVVVTITAPDMEILAGKISMSERMSFAAAVEKGKADIVKSKVDALLEEAEASAEGIPMGNEVRKISVVKTEEGEWKSVMPDLLDKTIQKGRSAMRKENFAAAEAALKRAEQLAPMQKKTKELSRNLVRRHVEAGEESLEYGGDLEEAKTHLAYAREHAPGLETTKRLQKKVKAEDLKRTYAADSIRVRVPSAKVVKRTRPGPEDVIFISTVEAENLGGRAVNTLMVEATVTLETSGGPIPDTTVRQKGEINLERGKGGRLKGGDSGVYKFNGRGLGREVSSDDLEATSFSLGSIEIVPKNIGFSELPLIERTL